MTLLKKSSFEKMISKLKKSSFGNENQKEIVFSKNDIENILKD